METSRTHFIEQALSRGETLADVVFAWAGHQPSATALVHAGERIAWQTLAQDVRQAAVWLHAQGLREHDRVAITCSDEYRNLCLCLAVMRVGACT